MNYLIILFSILPIILIGFYYYQKDTLKEPKKLLQKLFFSGIISSLLVIFISLLTFLFFPSLETLENASIWKLLFYSFIFVSLTEEFSKYLMIYKISYHHEDFDQMYDIILYSVFVGLGFACFENILYIISAENSLWVAIFRSFTAIPAHTCFQTFMGYYLSLYKFKDKEGERKNLYLSILIPTLLHGSYDFLLLSGNIFFICLFLVLLVSMFIATIRKIKKVVKIDGLNLEVCPNCLLKIENNFCPICGHKKKQS